MFRSFVAVEMVGGDVENDRNVGFEAVHVFKLEARQLDDVDVVVFPRYLQGEATANVAGKACVYTCLAQNVIGE